MIGIEEFSGMSANIWGDSTHLVHVCVVLIHLTWNHWDGHAAHSPGAIVVAAVVGAGVGGSARSG